VKVVDKKNHLSPFTNHAARAAPPPEISAKTFGANFW
jgi:hypothetical protein